MKRKPINRTKLLADCLLWARGENLFGNRFVRRVLFLPLLFILFGVFSVWANELNLIRNNYQKGDFKIVFDKKAADIFVSPDDFKVVRIAAGDFASDVERVTGNKPKLSVKTDHLSENVVLIGTLGKNSIIDDLAKSGKIDISQIEGKWESFLIAAVANPLPNVKSGLVIVGSDRRGTAFGVYELSQEIGVSPWYWWADVTPEHKKNLVLSAKVKRFGGEPSVKYRGIFLNDEDWGLQPWAAATFEPETGNIGPKTYARIFELLLRLKANTVWAAMHEVTRPFNSIPENKQIADDYAIVMGSSHAEPMLRNNVGEWTDDKERYNFVTNPEGVKKYWETRVKENGRFENIYTLGMRGIHDSPMQSAKTSTERIPILERIFGIQRSLLAEYVNPNVEKIPQIFCPYKEVLTDYRGGLKVPEDVTIVFPDDNFGYIRYFPNPAEQKRAGGFGVYYHISYLGRPLSYLWLETTPPALIWEEMSKAFDHNMRRFWILNVGDLKPAEIGAEFFLQMAWDIKKWRRDNLREYLKTWAKREFGEKYSAEIGGIMNEYYRLGFERKPEHLQWYLPGENVRSSDFSAIDYGDEMQKRLDAYESLTKHSEAIYERISPIKKDAFYELILYPVRGADLANERVFAVEKSVLYAEQGRASATDWAKRAEKADAQIKSDAAYFNEKLADGKWRGIMSPEIGKDQWTSMRSTPPVVPDSILKTNVPNAAGLGVAIEGREKSILENEPATLPVFNAFTKDVRFIDVFNTGKSSAVWTAKANRDWINLSRTAGNLSEDSRLQVSIDWSKVPKGNDVRGKIEIKSANDARKIDLSIFNPETLKNLKNFVESNGVISIEAENFTNKTEKNGASWQVIQGLGRTGDSVAIFPTTAESVEAENILRNSPSLEYQFYAFDSGDFEANCFLIPTQPLQNGKGLRYAVGIDNQPPNVVAVGLDAEVSSAKWSRNVLNATTVGTSKINISAGAHVLKIYMIDAGVVPDKIVLNKGGMKNSYLAPPETKVVPSK